MIRWFLLLAVLFNGAALAQTSRARREAAKPAAPATPAPTPPSAALPPPELPYDPDIARLSEVMGSLSFLRDLCGFKDGAAWRARMGDLLEAEGTTTERKERLAGSYNRGFYGFQVTYRICTPAARAAIERLTDEGGRLTRGITSRYGT